MSPASSSEPGTPGGTVVCLLVVNRIPLLPTAAIMSILHRSPVRVVVGYVDPAHIADIPAHERVEFLDLSSHVDAARWSDTQGEYREFGTAAAATAIALKWTLVEHCLTRGEPAAVIYSDVDVIWLEDAGHDITAAFRSTPGSQVLVQSQAVNAAVHLVCMGFVAFRGSARALEIVRECGRRNRADLIAAGHDGYVSDEAVLEGYMGDAAPGEILYLPQAAYPVGTLANLYRREPLLPGLEAPPPLIFHANFVFGLDAKLALLKRVLLELGRLDPYLGFDDD